MQNTVNIVFFFLFAAGLPVGAQNSGTPAADGAVVAITVETDKAIYKPSEGIQLSVAIHNAGKLPFYVIPSVGFGAYGEGQFWPEVKDANGKEIKEGYAIGGHSIAPDNVDFAEYVEQHWLLLQPGCFLGVTDTKLFWAGFPPGTYTLRVKYANSLMPWIFRGWTSEDVITSHAPPEP